MKEEKAAAGPSCASGQSAAAWACCSTGCCDVTRVRGQLQEMEEPSSTPRATAASGGRRPGRLEAPMAARESVVSIWWRRARPAGCLWVLPPRPLRFERRRSSGRRCPPSSGITLCLVLHAGHAMVHPLELGAATAGAQLPPHSSLQAVAHALRRGHGRRLPDVYALVVRRRRKELRVSGAPAHRVHGAAVALQRQQPLACAVSAGASVR